MKAITVVPGDPGRVEVGDVPEPEPEEGAILAEGRLLGVCGTDADIVLGHEYGWAPPGRERLRIGHESLGRVLEAPAGGGVAEGDLIAGVVRRPDPVPCVPCAHGEQDFCRNGRYTERGIKERDGFGAQRWRIEPEYAIRLDPGLGDRGVLMEPTSVVAKAWDQTDRFLARTSWRPEVALVTGAGPIGLLAALLGVQRGLEVHVLDLVESGPKPDLVGDLGATFHSGEPSDLDLAPDVVIECTGHGPLLFEVSRKVTPDGVICLTGISSGTQRVDAGANRFNNGLVLENTIVFGTVNASRRDFERAAAALSSADPGWLDRLITRRLPMDAFADGLSKHEHDVKVVLDLTT